VLLDSKGRLVGINTAIYSRSGGNMGIGFAIPVSTAKSIMDSLLKDGKVTRGWLGLEPAELSQESAEAFGIPKQAQTGQWPQGVLVAGVLQNGPAAKAGVKPGDVITQVASHPIGNVSELLSQVAVLPPGQIAQVQVLRGQQVLQLMVTPDARPLRRGPHPR
jgi:S1-C subfamily serine protease